MHPLERSNQQIGNPISSPKLLQTIQKSFSSSNSKQHGILLLEENLTEILSMIRKSIRTLSTLTSSNNNSGSGSNKSHSTETAKENILHHTRIIVYSLHVIVPILSSAKYVDHTLKLMQHAILIVGNYWMEQESKSHDNNGSSDNDSEEGIVVLLHLFGSLWESFATLLATLDTCQLMSTKSNLLPALFPIPIPIQIQIQIQTNGAKTRTSTNTLSQKNGISTSLSMTQLHKMVLDSLTTFVMMLCQYLPRQIPSSPSQTSKSTSNVNASLNEFSHSPSSFMDCMTLDCFPSLIHDSILPWLISLLLQQQQNQTTSSSSLQKKEENQSPRDIVQTLMKRLYKYVWNMATVVDKLPSSNSQISLEIRSHAISILFLSSPTSSSNISSSFFSLSSLLSSLSSSSSASTLEQQNFPTTVHRLMTKFMETACASAWKACAFYAQTQPQPLPSPQPKSKDPLETFHAEIGVILDKSMQLLYQHPNQIDTITQQSYMEYCAWRALQTCPSYTPQDKENRIPHSNINNLSKKDSHSTNTKPGPAHAHVDCPFSVLPYPFVASPHQAITNTTEDHLWQASLAVIFLCRSLQHEWMTKQIDSLSQLGQTSNIALKYVSSLNLSESFRNGTSPSSSLKQASMKCWRLLSYLKLNTFANGLIRCFDQYPCSTINESDTSARTSSEKKLLDTVAIMTAQVFDIYIIPVLSILAEPIPILFPQNAKGSFLLLHSKRNSEKKPMNVTKEHLKFQNIAMSSYLVSATLLDRVSESFLSNPNNMIVPHNITSCFSSNPKNIVAKADEHLKSAYQVVMGGSGINKQMVEITSNSLKGLGRRRIERTRYTSAILPLILSCHLLTVVPSDQSYTQLSSLYANLASMLQQLHHLPESVITYALSIRYKALELNSEMSKNMKTTTHDILLSVDTNGSSASVGLIVERFVGLYFKLWKQKHIQRTSSNKDASDDINIQPGFTNLLQNSYVGQILQMLQKSDNSNDPNVFSISSLFKVILSNRSFLSPDLCYEGKIEVLRDSLRSLCKEVCALSQNRSSISAEKDNSDERIPFLLKEIKLIVNIANACIGKMKNISDESVDCNDVSSSIYYIVASHLTAFSQSAHTLKLKLDNETNDVNEMAYAYGLRTVELLEQNKKQIYFEEEATLEDTIIHHAEYAAVRLFMNDLWERVTKINESIPSKFSISDILATCIETAKLIFKTNCLSGSESNEDEKSNFTVDVARDAILAIATTLYSRLCYEGSDVAAASAASLIYHLGEETRLTAAAKIAMGSSLSEGEIFNAAFDILMSSEDIYSEDMESTLLENEENVNIAFQHKLVDIEKKSLEALLEVRSCNPKFMASTIEKLDVILLEVDSNESSILGNENETIEIDSLKSKLDWISSTCVMGLSEAHERCGNISKSLFYSRKNCNLCRSALHNSRQSILRSFRRVQEPPGKIDLSSPLNMAWHWRNRLAQALRYVAVMYTRLGDPKRAEDYATTAIESLNRNNSHSDLSLGKMFFTNSFDQGNSHKNECLRVFWEIKSLRMPPDFISKEIHEFLHKSSLPSSKYTSEIISSAQSQNENGTKLINNFDNQIEEIRSLLTRGDMLRRCCESIAHENHELAAKDYNQIADHLLNNLINSECGLTLDNLFELKVTNSEPQQLLTSSTLPPLNSFTDIEGSMSTVQRNLGPLLCSLKLRQALTLEYENKKINEQDIHKLLVVRELYKEVQQSNDATALDRGRACYQLGLISLRLARKTGELHQRWKGHSICLNLCDSRDSSNNFTNEYTSNLDDAILYLSEAASYCGPASTPLGRKTLRLLALALGPENKEQLAALLIHRSIGSSARQTVSRSFHAEEIIEDQAFKTKMKSLFAAFDDHCENQMRHSSIDYLLEEADRSLPSEWNIVAATLCPTGELLLASIRASKTGKPESSIACIFPDEIDYTEYESAFQKDFIIPLDEIINRNRAQLFGDDHNAAIKLHGPDEAKRRWWKNREAADQELRLLLDRVENQYYGNDLLRHLFFGNLNEDYSSDNNSVDSAVSDELCDRSVPVGNLASKFEEACTMNERINDRISESEHVFDVEESKATLGKLTVVKLKQELEKYGIEKKVLRSLRKAGLVDLLVSEKEKEYREQRSFQNKFHIDNGFDDEENSDYRNDMCETTSTESPKSTQNGVTGIIPCLFLVLDEDLHRFPWEGMNMFATKSVCRVPSLPFVIAPVLEDKFISQVKKISAPSIEPKVKINSAKYVLDPEDNLEQTRKRLQPVLESFSSRFGWDGVIGEIPPKSCILDALMRQNSIYIYCGHGGGECCLSRSQVEALIQPPSSVDSLENTLHVYQHRRCRATVMLMGCSSASLHPFSRSKSEDTTISGPAHYEPDGIAISYLTAGAPCVIGNLWDVTDRDIDRFFVDFLNTFLEDGDQLSGRRSIPECVSKARNSCKMRYLVGCAPVCYGVPVVRL